MPGPEIVDEICVIDTELRIHSIAARAAWFFGQPASAMTGLSLAPFIAPGDLPKLTSMVLAAHADESRILATTIGIRQSEDGVLPMEFICRATGIARSPGTLLVTIRPVSERGPLDDQLAAVWY